MGFHCSLGASALEAVSNKLPIMHVLFPQGLES